MLDIIVKSIMRKLDVHVDEVRSQRVEIERERAGGKPRTIATAILQHPEGYATSPREAARSAQKAYAKARGDWEQHGIPMLTKLATLAVARERRDETAAVFREHEEKEAVRKATKVHPDFRRLNDTMIAHGVQTGHAATATPGIIAIASDIIMWAGADPDLLDPDSPLRDILEVYATRLILTPGQFGDKSRSQPGVPVRQVKYTDPEHYLFNEAAQPAVDIAAGTKPEPAVKSVAVYDDNEAPAAPVEGERAQETITAVASAPPATLMPAGQSDVGSQPISPEFALHIAETVFDKNPFKLSIYWPKDGYPVGDYDPARLIPALEKAIGVDPWEGWKGFLAAAQQGQAREYIESRRHAGVSHLAAALQRGEERALAEGRLAGFDV